MVILYVKMNRTLVSHEKALIFMSSLPSENTTPLETDLPPRYDPMFWIIGLGLALLLLSMVLIVYFTAPETAQSAPNYMYPAVTAVAPPAG